MSCSLAWLFVAVGSTATEAKPLKPLSVSNLPVVFEENRGQSSPEVRYTARTGRYSLELTDSGVKVAVAGRNGSTGRLHLQWLQASRNPKISGLAPTGGVSNYLKGPGPRGWTLNVPHYSRVRYRAVYPGIDLVFYGNRQNLEFDFVIAPGADPSAVRMRVQGAKRLRVDKDGALVCAMAHGELRLQKPVLYQPTPHGRKEVDGAFVIAGGDVVAFRVGGYDRSETLVIDPTLVTAYVGGRDADIVTAVATDPSGNIYAAGYTTSVNFPLSATPFKSVLTPGDADAFVLKMDSTMSTVLYATFLGGPSGDYANAIAADSSGAYITGTTIGRFPTTSGAFREVTSQSPTIFAAKLNASGGALIYATYLDGAGAGQGIAVDSSGNAYVAGFTYTANFSTTTGAFQRIYGSGTDAFVVKLNSTGTTELYSTFLGGAAEDIATGIKVDVNGAAYVTGFTSSPDFPVSPGAFRTAYSGSTDAFAAKLNAAGSALLYSTFLGGPSVDRAHALDVNLSGEAFIAGQTYSSSYPTTAGAFRTTSGGGGDAFVTKLNAGGTGLVYSTFLGGSGVCTVPDPFRIYQCDAAFGIAIDSAGQAYAAGLAGSSFPVAGAQQPAAAGNGDAFLTWINAAGSDLLYSTYIGGSGGEVALAVAYSTASGAIVGGFTNSLNLPVSGFDTTHGGGAQEGFLSRAAACTITLGSSGSFFPAQAGTYLLDVFAPPSCAWSATVNQSWVTINSGSGAGNGQVNYTVAANAGAFRTALITVNGQTFNIQQVAGNCVSLGSSGSWFPQAGGSYAMQVFATCSWIPPTSNASWLTVYGWYTSSGFNGGFSYALTANNTGIARFGQIDAGGQKFDVSQVGGPAALSSCQFVLSSTVASFTRDGGSSSLLVSTLDGCEWTARNTASWITLTAGPAGRGEGVIGFSASRNNTGEVRQTTLAVEGRSLTIVQMP
ncbi:MAG TPA: SBBP repeat-containing protein [Bryobacteraceae bacterium]|nr:SBBP repeat-containing protein [Bryobacteraceae bacterium]